MCNYDHSPKGRICLGWNADRVTINVLKIHEQFIHCSVSSKGLSTQIHLTVVYGLHSIHDRLPMWEGIRNISIQHSPWLCAGDFNSVLHTSDRLHGTNVTDYDTRDFQSLVDDLDLTKVKSKGAFYSWSNKAHTGPRTLSRIDRVFGKQAWLASHGHVETVYLPPSLSDHSPVLLDICSTPAVRGRPFKFLNCIADHPDFLDTVSQAWGSGSSVWKKLNYVNSSIKSLNSKQFGNIEDKINQANVELAGIQNLMAQNPNDLDLYAKEYDAIKVVKHRNDIQESIFKQKSRINWIKLGDGNSHYFFSLMKNRQARNRIDSIFDSNQVLLKDPDAISHEVIFFYKSFLGTQAPWLPDVDLVTMRRGTLPKQWNCTTITLVPKIPNASHVRDFRPIACCIVVYKLISKVITARLVAIIGEVIDDAQAGFIPVKHIGDNILLATKFIKGYDHKFISPRCMVKVDLKKAYDSVEWGFLITIMQELGFPQRFVSWVWTCLTSVSYSVLINGFPAPPFEAKKGLRQGDPMSPFVFSIRMEYLSRCLDELRLTPDFNFHPRCEKLNLTHMMFADDLLMFSRADSVSVKLFFQAFLKFSGASRLSANLDKSEVYLGGVSVDVQTELRELLGVSQGTILFRYLGVPLSSKKLTIAQCRPLVEKVTARIQGWMAKHLFYAGRLQLVKSKILKEIEARFRCFLWTGSSAPAKKSLVAWNYVCLPKGNKMKIKKLYAAIRPQVPKVWNKVLSILHVSKPVQQFGDEIEWLKKICRSSRLKNKVIHVAFTETVVACLELPAPLYTLSVNGGNSVELHLDRGDVLGTYVYNGGPPDTLKATIEKASKQAVMGLRAKFGVQVDDLLSERIGKLEHCEFLYEMKSLGLESIEKPNGKAPVRWPSNPIKKRATKYVCVVYQDVLRTLAAKPGARVSSVEVMQIVGKKCNAWLTKCIPLTSDGLECVYSSLDGKCKTVA
ncbi:uncharacterized protein LOC110728715 [Chenopodium quinoa]|uniref:uncharacterized protein LOC110728715 n=1 Tax=Chenopodium quinoa TaxID=63459 RepID=UPI000B7712DD|nr:uncharacterized protein LOC110728715 [Chenopodium quinoa]